MNDEEMFAEKLSAARARHAARSPEQIAQGRAAALALLGPLQEHHRRVRPSLIESCRREIREKEGTGEDITQVRQDLDFLLQCSIEDLADESVA